jgi:hypothetical protein
MYSTNSLYATDRFFVVQMIDLIVQNNFHMKNLVVDQILYF